MHFNEHFESRERAVHRVVNMKERVSLVYDKANIVGFAKKISWIRIIGQKGLQGIGVEGKRQRSYLMSAKVCLTRTHALLLYAVQHSLPDIHTQSRIYTYTYIYMYIYMYT